MSGPALYDAEGASLVSACFSCRASPWSMLPAAESAVLPHDELSDQWKSPCQRAVSLLFFCSIDLLSGGVGRASLSCRIISRRRTRSWTNALVDECSQIQRTRSIDLLSGGVGRAPFPCRTISCWRTRFSLRSSIPARSCQIVFNCRGISRNRSCQYVPIVAGSRWIVQTLLFYSLLTPSLFRF